MLRSEARDKRNAHKHINAFDYVQENFVLPVSDSFRPPRNGIGDCRWWAGLNLEFVRFLRDIFLKNLALRRLGVAKVHHFVQKLVNDDEIVAYTLFFEFLEILDENLDESVQEDYNFGSVGVSLGQGED